MSKNLITGQLACVIITLYAFVYLCFCNRKAKLSPSSNFEVTGRGRLRGATYEGHGRRCLSVQILAPSGSHESMRNSRMQVLGPYLRSGHWPVATPYLVSVQENLRSRGDPETNSWPGGLGAEFYS